MNLEGSLDAFGLPDVVTLLASTGKSGGLLLSRGSGSAPGAVRGAVRGALWFRDGRVCGATGDRSRAGLVRRLIGSGAVDDAALRHAVSRAGSGDVGVAKALLESGAVDPQLLRQAADDQAVDAVFDLLRWPDGEFSFDPASVDPDEVGLDLDPARLLAEAAARVEAWPALAAVVPSGDAVVSATTVLDADPAVTRDEWALLSLVDGQRRVRDLVELTGAGEFAVTTLLARLVERGLLQVLEAGSADHVTVVQRRLALLSGVEDGAIADPAPQAPTAPAPVAAPPVAEDQPAVATPGGLGMTAAAALAAARAAQGLPGAVAPAAGRPEPRPRHEVVPPRPEPFLPGRRPEHPEPVPVGSAFAPAPALARPRPAAGPSTAASAPVPTVPSGISATSPSLASVAESVQGATARSLATETAPDGVIERDPSVNRSLLLRLIAGVRGL